MVPLGTVVLAGVLVMAFMLAWNAGMGLPSGYKKDYLWPLTSDNKERAYFIGNQFKDENLNQSNNHVIFMYNGERYYLEDSSGYFAYINSTMSVYKTANEELLGTFVRKEPPKDYEYYQSYNYIFFDGHYLYYSSEERIYRDTFHFPWQTGGPFTIGAYYKHEFYRFDLDTGINEKIKTSVFLEKIRIYDGSIKLNKK